MRPRAYNAPEFCGSRASACRSSLSAWPASPRFVHVAACARSAWVSTAGASPICVESLLRSRLIFATTDRLIASAPLRTSPRSLTYRVFDIPGPQTLADRNDDLAAAIDDDGSAGPLEPWAGGDLDNRNGQQRNEKDDHRTHVPLHSSTLRWRLTSTD